MTIKAALLDAPSASGKGKYLRIDALADEAALTEFHLPQITDCDLPPNRYVWVPDKPGVTTASGGEFMSHETLNRRNQPSFDLAFAGLASVVEASGVALPPETRAYLTYLGARRTRLRNGGNA